MLAKMFAGLRCHKRIVTRPFSFGDESVTDRQERLPGFSQAALQGAKGVLIGAGGLNGEVAEGLVRKGLGVVLIMDHDQVEPSNLNRQFFFRKDVYRNKALRLAANLAPHALCGTVFHAYAMSFEDARASGVDLSGNFAVCGVDNSQARVAVANHYRGAGTPVVFIAVDHVAEHGYVFVQEPGHACFGCVFPDCLKPRKVPCRTPACKDINKTVAGLALYAVDSLLMDRRRGWNFRNIHLAGFAPSNELTIQKRDDCPLCGNGAQGQETKEAKS